MACTAVGRWTGSARREEGNRSCRETEASDAYLLHAVAVLRLCINPHQRAGKAGQKLVSIGRRCFPFLPLPGIASLPGRTIAATPALPNPSWILLLGCSMTAGFYLAQQTTGDSRTTSREPRSETVLGRVLTCIPKHWCKRDVGNPDVSPQVWVWPGTGHPQVWNLEHGGTSRRTARMPILTGMMLSPENRSKKTMCRPHKVGHAPPFLQREQALKRTFTYAALHCTSSTRVQLAEYCHICLLNSN